MAPMGAGGGPIAEAATSPDAAMTIAELGRA
jgi:hypothetical protein